jgi:selenocysteine lyase/cysteine desulfurase
MTRTIDHGDVGPLAPVVSDDLLVPLAQGGWTRYVNLDYAASAPALVDVQRALADALPLYASVHRGAGYPSQVCTAAYEQARLDVASFVRARAGDVVVFTRNTTDALTLLARSVPGAVVHLDLEHHANQLPWRGASRIVAAAASVEQTLEALAAALAAEPVALLAVTGASNVTGEVLPLRELADLAHRHGARLAVDGAQLVPHRRVDVAATGIDYLAFSGHKAYAPFGAGVLVGRRDWLDSAPPHQPGGGAVREVTVTGVEWTTSPARHEGGTPNVLGALTLAAAVRALAALDADEQAAHEAALLDRLTAGLARLGIEVLRVWPEHRDVVGLAPFSVPGYDAESVAAYLSAEHGIGVRDGRFCAHPLLRRFGVEAAVRASFGLGSSSADVDALLDALEALRRAGPGLRYVRTDAGLVPETDRRRFPDWAGTVAGEASPCGPGGDDESTDEHFVYGNTRYSEWTSTARDARRSA